MDGIVSFLDSKHNQLIEELWAELKQEFSVDGVYITPYPHFSYHVAQDYDVDKVEPVLQRITSNITTFKVRTSGLGVITGTSPILYIPVVRSLELTQLHQELWQEITPTGSGVQQARCARSARDSLWERMRNNYGASFIPGGITHGIMA